MLCHADDDRLQAMAVLDALANNADRKGGHVLAMPDGHRYGVDHGLTFHVEHKLRTVLWGWAGEPIAEDDLLRLKRLRDALADDGPRERLLALLPEDDVDALAQRIRRLLDRGVHPFPSPDWPSVPWPPL